MMGKDYMLAIIIVNCDDNIWTDQNLLLDPDLPSGWRTIQDSTGTYYWHVPTGATQWQHPRLNGTPTQPHPDAQDDQKPPSVFEVPTDTRSWTAADSCRRDDNSQCFTVRSLGWLQVEEEDLSPGRSSLVVGNVIQQLSRSGDGGGDGGGGPPEQRNGPGLLTEGREMKLLLKQDTLTLVDPVDHTPLYCQPIINIRVWGVGSNNGRDFAFVAADKDSCVLKCHVFRCDAPAKAIATALHRMCSQMMSQQTSRSLSMDSISPEDLPRQVEFLKAGLQRIYKFDVYYVGNLPVSRAMGMEVLNLAIESIMNSTQRHEWEATVIHVTDNFLSVFKQQEGEEPVWACQVRFLSFLGVGHDSRTFAVIVDGGRQRFECHVFWCEPNAGLLSEAVQAACMVQYQKCLVAQTPPPRSRLQHGAAPKVKRANSVDGAAFNGNGGVLPRKVNGGHGRGVRRGMMAFFDTFRNKQPATS
ncbi:amyloid-beta A4 precursor protein-binding family B member 3 isoform X2 [Syngnathoides biaculeatus]|uniref:amyloid-beta A4 precursor protein-binding family B member 3 isoform X2 n=1 Tax=Syngnathoides biaculeatus TaxID=300417 RepID=UPI002ADD4838|nr:amyloid-beta A4 precursor protein-binding family B member 3 isoform X2 [Syngnathoides biaculeatus]